MVPKIPSGKSSGLTILSRKVSYLIPYPRVLNTRVYALAVLSFRSRRHRVALLLYHLFQGRGRSSVQRVRDRCQVHYFERHRRHRSLLSPPQALGSRFSVLDPSTSSSTPTDALTSSSSKMLCLGSVSMSTTRTPLSRSNSLPMLPPLVLLIYP